MSQRELVELSLNPCSDDTAARAGVHGDGLEPQSHVSSGRAHEPPVRMSARSDTTLSCSAWAKDTVAFRSYRALGGSQSHFQGQLGLKDWTAHRQDSSNPFIDIPPVCRSVLLQTRFT